MSSVKLHFDNFRGHYMAGETINGRLVCSFHSEKNVRGITIKLQGTEHTSWKRRVSRKDVDGHMRTTYETCTGQNDFLNNMVTVYGQGDIQAGRHEYPFSFILPSHIPSTFEHTRGWINYRIKAIVDRPWKTDFEDAVVFDVRSPIDLNLSSNLKKPISMGDDKNVCCLCCVSGPITLDLYLDQSGFVPGEFVRPRINVVNLSNTDVDDLSVRIIMTYTFRTESPCEEKEDIELLASVSETGVGAHGERTYALALEIPSTTQIPNFNLCKLFEYSCELKVCAEFGCHIDLEITTPLTMGNIPIIRQDTIPPPNYAPPSTIGFAVNGATSVVPPMSMPMPIMPGSMSVGPPMPMPPMAMHPPSPMPSIPMVPPPMPYSAPSAPSSLPTAPPASEKSGKSLDTTNNNNNSHPHNTPN